MRHISGACFCGVVLTVLSVAVSCVSLRDLPRGHRAETAASGRVGAVERPAAPGGTVNVNEAGVDELMMLPGVGETLAQAIIDEREANGPFRYPEDLMAVRGIGASKLEKMRSLLDLGAWEMK